MYCTNIILKTLMKHNHHYVAFVHLPVHNQTPWHTRGFCYVSLSFYDKMKHIGYIRFVRWNI